jgi:hypothetical protein
VVGAVIAGVKMTKVLIYGGSGKNILYKDAFEKLNIETSKLHPSHSLSHGIVPRRWVIPLGTITLSVTFGDQVHYRKETLSSEIVDFEGPYHVILRRPCYAKFMAIPSYAYLKLKIPGLRGVITIVDSFQDAYECERVVVEHAQWDMILDEPKHTNEDKQEAGSGMPRRSPRSLEHRLTPKTPASVLPLESAVPASPATLVPPKAPGLPEEAKTEEGTNALAVGMDPVTGA